MRQLEKVLWAARAWTIGSTSGGEDGQLNNCRSLIKIRAGGLQ
jgi:hypothetical protein